MKVILCIIFQIAFMSAFAQLQPVTSGVFHWSELPVKKDKQREGRKIAEGTTPEFSYFEIHATTQYKGATPGRHIHRIALKNSSSSKKEN